MITDPTSKQERGAPRKQELSDEAIEEIKKGIVFGTGYKRPPESGRFKKGQSGNPKGRPKKSDLSIGSSRSTNNLVLREAERLITIREGDEVRQIPAIEAVHRAQYASATRGNAYAQKHIVERYDRAEQERRRQIADEIEIWKRYIEVTRKEIAEAKAKGEPLPVPVPHPDDVVINHKKGVRFIGPVNEREVAQMKENLKVRDVLLMQNALDQREAGCSESSDPDDRLGTALLFAIILNRGVPERFRLLDNEILLRMIRYDVMPKRALLKQLYRAWLALGVRARRGMTLPPLRFAKQVIEEIQEFSCNEIGPSDDRFHSAG